MRSAHRRRVSRPDVGRRVSVRHRLRDGTVTDTVGRLTSWPLCTQRPSRGALVIVERDGTGHEIPVDAVLSSRVIPTHPRLALEPETPSVWCECGH